MRIISGQFKGKKILQPKDKNTRLKDLTKNLFLILLITLINLRLISTILCS